jgi:hypothetical protein
MKKVMMIAATALVLLLFTFGQCSEIVLPYENKNKGLVICWIPNTTTGLFV